MRAWIEALNTVLNIGIGIALGVLILMFIIAELRSGQPTWREQHRRVRRKRDKDSAEGQRELKHDDMMIMLLQASERAKVQAVSSIVTSMAIEEAKTLRAMAENDQSKAMFDAIQNSKDFTAEAAHKAFSGIKRDKEQ